LGDVRAGPVAVDGAEGFIGRAVLRALAAHGVPVRGLVLSASARANGPWERAVCPPGDGGALREALAGCRAVVAARRLLEEVPRLGFTFAALQTERAGALARAAERAGIGRLLYVGLARRGSGAGDRLAEAEARAEARIAAARVPARVLAPSLVVGPGDGHVSRMARKARSMWPALVFVGQGWAKSAPMTARDFARCAAKLLLEGDFPGEKLLVGGPELVTAMDVQDRLLRLRGRAKVKLHVPETAAMAAAGLAELVSRRPPVTTTRLGWLLRDLIPDRKSSEWLLGRRPERFERAFGPPAAPSARREARSPT
jgi:NADH dehydrogenase